jgi:1-acyl-sn-glycerol-3-phosphate acyltransferase
MQTVQPPLEFIAPSFQPWLLSPVQFLSRIWLKQWRNIQEINGNQLETLADLYHQFQQGQTRLLIAFRHPTIEDPICLEQILANHLPHTAAQAKIPLQKPLHAHFIYDRGIPLWAGATVGWLLPRVGAIPMYRGKLDRKGLRVARQLFVHGQFPLAIAPEGAINGHSRIINPLEPGSAQLAFWCYEDLQNQPQKQRVMILPIGIQYHYLRDPMPEIQKLLSKLEVATGIISPSPAEASPPERIFKLSQHLLTKMETYYQTFHPGAWQKSCLKLESLCENAEISSYTDPELQQRLHRLLEAALLVAEADFQLSDRGNLMSRCHAIEQAAWERIYRDDLEIGDLSAVDRALADRIAQEASSTLWHLRLVEIFNGVQGRNLGQGVSVDRLAETVLHLCDVVNRMQSETCLPKGSPLLGPRRAEICIGQPLSVDTYWPQYQQQRRQAVQNLTTDLQKALEALMV